MFLLTKDVNEFIKRFIIINLHFSLPLLILVILIFRFKNKKYFFSILSIGFLACFINWFVNVFILNLLRLYYDEYFNKMLSIKYSSPNYSGFYNKFYLNCVLLYELILKYFVFAFFCIVFKIIVFKFFLKKKDVDDFKKAFYFSIGSSFLANPFWRFLSFSFWFEGYYKVLKSELFLLGVNSLSLFIFELCFSLLILYIFKKIGNLKRFKKILLYCLFFGILVILDGIIFYFLRMPDTLPYRDVIAVRYNLSFENEVVLGIFFVFAISVILSLKNVLLGKNIEKLS